MIDYAEYKRIQSTGFNFAGLFVARIGLGLFEACFGPGIPLYLCWFFQCSYKCRTKACDSDLAYYYTRHELGVRLACYQSFAAVAGAFSGLVAFGIQNAHTAIANWRLLFIIEVKGFFFLGYLLNPTGFFE